MLQARLEQRQTLLVSVLEARGLAPRKGVVVAFQASQLPNPLVEVTAPGHAPHRAAAAHTLKPVFPDAPPGRFPALAPDAVVTVRLLDRKAGSRDAVLGTASFAAARAGPGSQTLLNPRQGGGRRVGAHGSADEGPLYVWLPLVAPRALLGWRARRAGSVVLEEGDGVPELQVCGRRRLGTMCFLRSVGQWLAGCSKCNKNCCYLVSECQHHSSSRPGLLLCIHHATLECAFAEVAQCEGREGLRGTCACGCSG